ncbi:MAG: hypothetical protein FD123_2560 [Bacteroidetes bacterium]|nr:MAG: hypothetical protein FD123_2560 [Bacteroidota bacterium]
MAELTRDQLKAFFETGDIPTEDQFADLIDSYIHKLDDGVSIFVTPTGKRFGIGTTTPESPLGIQAEGDDRVISMTSADGLSEWHITLNPTAGDVKGFSIEEETAAGNISRIFAEKGTGMVGIGNTDPTAKLHITDANPDSATAMKIENAQVGTEPGVVNRAWQLGHIHDPSIPERMGAFSILEETTGTTLAERITILPTQHVGVNEPLPDATLHVNRSVIDPLTKVQLVQGSGITMIGTLEGSNLVLDYQAIQARLGEVIGGNLSLSKTDLHVQPLGGAVVFHSDPLITADKKVTITDDGKMSVGLDAPTERLHVNGAVIVGDTTTAAPAVGTIRYNTTTLDLEGYVSGAWASLTGNTGSNFWQSAGTDMIRYNTADAKVAIGIDIPAAALHVENDTDVVDGNSIGAIVNNTAVISTPGATGTRLGLKVSTSDTWSTSTSAKNVGIAVNATGMTEAHQNIAASLGGNVVVGGIVAQVIGTGGDNVLAIQNGATPAGPPGGSESGIQIYSANLSSTTTSIFNVMNGDGNTVRLYRQTGSMNTPLTTTPNTGDVPTDTLIDNMRTRINQLETILKNLGILAP